MSEKTKAWIHSFRLRTLPLALSSIILGGLLSARWNFNATDFIFALFTTLFLQILSNLANDYGDFHNGADSHERVGPQRAVQSGVISPAEMKKMIIIFVLLSLISGIMLLYSVFGVEKMAYALAFFALGIAAIVAAIKYTAGKNPYGYKGFGDLFVFLFFGWVGVIGTFYLTGLNWNWIIFLPATSLGLFSVGVLNLNNMRDIHNDEKVGKRTIPVILGAQKAKIYHYWLLLGGWIFALAYLGYYFDSALNLIALISLPLFAKHLTIVYKTEDAKHFDSELKKLALSTLLFALSFGAALLF
jgi:1,4-dihydroxy-2-naphthoate octaprenyltransferase